MNEAVVVMTLHDETAGAYTKVVRLEFESEEAMTAWVTSGSAECLNSERLVAAQVAE